MSDPSLPPPPLRGGGGARSVFPCRCILHGTWRSKPSSHWLPTPPPTRHKPSSSDSRPPRAAPGPHPDHCLSHLMTSTWCESGHGSGISWDKNWEKKKEVRQRDKDKLAALLEGFLSGWGFSFSIWKKKHVELTYQFLVSCFREPGMCSVMILCFYPVVKNAKPGAETQVIF